MELILENQKIQINKQMEFKTKRILLGYRKVNT
jgi:hypothetical protein